LSTQKQNQSAALSVQTGFSANQPPQCPDSTPKTGRAPIAPECSGISSPTAAMKCLPNFRCTVGAGFVFVESTTGSLTVEPGLHWS
ncbi:MAG: hypothetical protein ACI8RZ_007057, partial [Myxococcota bacterium]